MKFNPDPDRSKYEATFCLLDLLWKLKLKTIQVPQPHLWWPEVVTKFVRNQETISRIKFHNGGIYERNDNE
jgi:hypothetical protein